MKLLSRILKMNLWPVISRFALAMAYLTLAILIPLKSLTIAWSILTGMTLSLCIFRLLKALDDVEP